MWLLSIIVYVILVIYLYYVTINGIYIIYLK